MATYSVYTELLTGGRATFIKKLPTKQECEQLALDLSAKLGQWVTVQRNGIEVSSYLNGEKHL